MTIKCKDCGKEVEDVDDEGLCDECSLYTSTDDEWGDLDAEY